MPKEWSGHYYDGLRTTRNPVTVTLTAKSVVITKKDQTRIEWPVTEVRQTQGFYAGEPVKLMRSREALVVPSTDGSNDFLNALKAITPQKDAKFNAPQTRFTRFYRAMLAAVAGIAVIATMYVWVIPAISNAAADKIPPSWEEKLGNSVIEGMLRNFKTCEDKRSEEAVAKIMLRLTAAAGPNPYTFKVHIVKASIMNAFALPGGHIILFTGLINKTGRPEELAGVLSHEMQHILKRHSTKRIMQSFSTGMILTMLAGDAAGAINAVNILNNMRYSRIAEEEADREGLTLMKRAQVDPAGLIDFFDKLEKNHGMAKPGILSYLSTHPETSDRIALLKSHMPRNAQPYENLLPDTDWAEVSKICSTKNPKEQIAPENCDDGSQDESDDSSEAEDEPEPAYRHDCEGANCTDAQNSQDNGTGTEHPDLGQRPASPAL